MPLISVIVAMYNAKNTITRALLSVANTVHGKSVEIIVVDDCSQDESLAVAEKLCTQYPNIFIYKMPQNSGGPSAPRNLGIEKATGEYITFLDADDWFDADNLLQMVEAAKTNDYDYLKGYCMVVNQHAITPSNQLLKPPTEFLALRKAFVEKTSTTQDFIVKRSLLMAHDIRYDPQFKIGEDTLFVFSIFTHCQKMAYMDSYFLYYNKTPSDFYNPSSTQQCNDREINSQLSVWEKAQALCQEMNLDYTHLRLAVGFSYLLQNIVRYSTGIEEATFNRLSAFCNERSSVLAKTLSLHPRFLEIYKAILAQDYSLYLKVTKQRLLIAGYDLKFILPLVPYLKKSHEVRVDEWSGHNQHDKAQSTEYLQWADLVFCEWLLQNAVWYSWNLKKHQRMIIRAHRFELWRDFGHEVNYNRVSCIITVGYHYFEQFQKTFNIPRHKMRLLPNYVENDIYSSEKSERAAFTLGLVGSLPKRKGLKRALDLLYRLRLQDERFRLCVMGQRATDVSWIQHDARELSYYQDCEEFIEKHGLKQAVFYGGFVERQELYKDIGYVLSLSDTEKPESFHLAPAEGACANSLGLLLHWEGVEYLYPASFIFESTDEIEQEILKACQNPAYYQSRIQELQEFVLENYSIQQFLERLSILFSQIYMLG